MAWTKGRRATIDLRDEVFADFVKFAAAAFPEQGLGPAVREACLVLMGTEPMEAARVAARRAAWLAVSRAARAAFGAAFTAARRNLDDLGTKLEESVITS